MKKTLSLYRNRRTISILSVVLLAVSTMLPALIQSQAQAAQITNRSLTLMTGTTPSDVNGDNLPDGGSAPGATANHYFEFDIEGGNVGSIKFEYCTTAAEVPGGIDCDTPTGMDATGAALGSEDGATGFSNITTTTNQVVISRASATATSAQSVSYRLDDIVNPTTTNETFFVRISTHVATDGTDTPIDFGTVAASTATPIELSGTMPESLVFCTGGSIDTTGGVPDCTTATSGSVSFDRLFSPTITATALSQMAASTNAGQGYAITVNGPTLTSGTSEIDPMDDGAGGSASIILGTSQFGMNLVENVTTEDADSNPLGLDVSPQPNGTNYRGDPTADYGAEDLFKFLNGDVVAESDEGTDSQIFTKSYIVNVPGSQPAGTYTTTLTYIATATF